MTVKQIKESARIALSGKRMKSAFALIVSVLILSAVNFILSYFSFETQVYDIVTACLCVLFAFPFFATVMKYFLAVSRGEKKKLIKVLSPFDRSFMTLLYFSFLVYVAVYALNCLSLMQFEDVAVNTMLTAVKYVVYIYLFVWFVMGSFVISDSTDVNFLSFLRYTNWYVKKTFFRTVKVTLSFVCLFVLSILTLGIALLWVAPYFLVCLAKIYDSADEQLICCEKPEGKNRIEESVTEEKPVEEKKPEEKADCGDETVVFTKEMLEKIKNAEKNE